MITSRMGCELELTAYCGKHACPGYPLHMMLIQAIRKENGNRRYYFATFLRADGGMKEIDAAIDALPEVELMPDELQKAIREAM